MRRLVVVGGGMAAVRLVEELLARPGGGQWQVTVLADEEHPPYNRILLSAVLEGTHSVSAITLRSTEWFAERGVDWRCGARVLQLDREAHEVVLVDGTRLPYDALVLATGAIPTLPPIRGMVRPDGTLHPSVHAGLLADRNNPEHVARIEELGIVPFDLVVVNLYPFRDTVASGASEADCIEKIDIGGPAMVRASAKNHGSVAIVVDPNGYDDVLQAVRDGGFTGEQRMFVSLLIRFVAGIQPDQGVVECKQLR